MNTRLVIEKAKTTFSYLRPSGPPKTDLNKVRSNPTLKYAPNRWWFTVGGAFDKRVPTNGTLGRGLRKYYLKTASR
jgi:hypothetical protein